MDEAVDGCHCHALVGKDAVPFAEWLIGSNDEAGAFVAVRNQLKQHARFLLIPTHITDVVDDQEAVPVQLEQCFIELQRLLRFLQVLNQFRLHLNNQHH